MGVPCSKVWVDGGYLGLRIQGNYHTLQGSTLLNGIGCLQG